MNMPLRQILFIVALLGLLVSGYLFITYTTGGPIICGSHGCEDVRASAYAHFGGIPTPFFGVMFYVLLAIGALLLTPERQQRLQLPLQVLTGIGVVVSLYLSYLEAYVIEAWCQWCVVSALLTIIAFGLVWFRLPKYEYHH